MDKRFDFEKMCEGVFSVYPHFRLKTKYKDESYFMRFLSKVLFFNKNFSTIYTTTIGDTIYYPSREYVESKPKESLVIFFHELYHYIDYKKNPALFVFLYLFPQVLSVFSVISIFSSSYYLLFLLFLLPIPAYFRASYEVSAYKVSLYMCYLILKHCEFKSDEEIVADLIRMSRNYSNHLSGSDYFYTWPFGVKDELYKFSEAIVRDNGHNDVVTGELKLAMLKSTTCIK